MNPIKPRKYGILFILSISRFISFISIGTAYFISRKNLISVESMYLVTNLWLNGVVLMVKREIDKESSLLLKEKLRKVWDIKDYYWYPLAKTSRNDVIAFNYKYVNEKSNMNYLKEVLASQGVSNIYEYAWGSDYCTQYDITKTDQLFWKSDPRFWECYNEGFWFSDTMDWIIYFTHEETVTIGGQYFVDILKTKWSDWRNYINWDTKN
jgi:hypothetical protein